MAKPDRLGNILTQAERDRKRLDSTAFGPFSLTALGIASVVGAGIFVITGTAAAEHAGPAVVISFVIAGIAAGLTALCYAEMAAMIPIAGSTYSYVFAAFGVFMAWFIGWDLLLEYLFAASTVAVGWAGYAVSLLDSVGIHVPHDLANPPFEEGGIFNLPAFIVVVLTTFLLAIGTKESVKANNIMVAIKVGALLLFVAVGAFHVDASNWSPFVPANTGSFGEFGASGVIQAAGIVFFAYVGFDAVSTAAGESRNPQRTVPIGLLGTVIISTALYVVIGLVMVGLVPYSTLNVADPISEALKAVPGIQWLDELISVAAVVGLFATVLVTFYGQTRILMRMSEDGLLPARFGKVSPRFKTPVFTTVVCGIAGAIIASLLPITVLGELVSIGTLFSFLLVCSGVLVLRKTHPDTPRPFRVPAVKLVAPLGIVSSLALMLTLPPDTWIRLGVWLVIGLLVFFLYGRKRSREIMSVIATGVEANREAATEPNRTS
ncbi:MAG: basic amino acid/polyamine antiporter, family [Actinomycetota bacterium]|jgi:APA family basic amino acid/polyamine antiporter|nr:basic amino acid/polyamine antiporter, family [Actinomycetota bacterium]